MAGMFALLIRFLLVPHPEEVGYIIDDIQVDVKIE